MEQKEILILTCRIFIGSFGVLLLVQAIMWSFTPTTNMTAYGITVDNNLGLNMIKSNIGAGLFAIVIFSFLYLFKGKEWFLPLVILDSGYLVIRTISLIVDGYHQIILFAIVLETLFLIAVFGHERLQE